MRVLFDAYWWIDGQISGRRVVDSLLRTWLDCWPEDDLVAAVPARDLVRARELADGSALTLQPLRLQPHGVSVMTELGAFARDVDVVFTQNFTPLRARALRATFIHDLMFEDRPEFFRRSERLYFAGMPWSARFADILFTSTAAEAARISRVRPRLVGRVRPVGLTVPATFHDCEPADPNVGVVPGQFLLCVGRLNMRKNVDRLIDALLANDLIRPDFPLVVVGEPDGLALRGVQVDDGRVRFLGGVSDAELKWLYEHCELFVFPSLDEGFGLPLLEAALCRTPMALSDIPAFRELAPEGAFFDPTDSGAIATAVREQLTSRRPEPEVDVPAWSDVVDRIRSSIDQGLRARG